MRKLFVLLTMTVFLIVGWSNIAYSEDERNAALIEEPQFENYKWGSSVDEVKEMVVSKGFNPYFSQDFGNLSVYPDAYKILDKEVTTIDFYFTLKTQKLYKIILLWSNGDVGPLLLRILTEKYGKSAGFSRSIYCNWNGISEGIYCDWEKNQVIIRLISNGLTILTYVSCDYYNIYEEEKIEADKDKF